MAQTRPCSDIAPGELIDSIYALASVKAAATQNAYHQTLEIFASYLGLKLDSYGFERRVLGFTPREAMGFLAWLKKRRTKDGSRMSDNTVAQRLAILRRVFRHLNDIGARLGNPIACIADAIPGRQRVQKRPTKLIPFDAVQRFLDMPPANTKAGIRDRALLAILFGGGLRRSEAMKLNLEDIGEGADGVPFLILRNTKGGTNQQQSLPPWAWERLIKYLEQRDADQDGNQALFVFYYRKGTARGRLSTETAARLYKRYARAAGIGNAAPHSARATAVTMLKELGYEDREVAKFLRHSTTRQVEVYDKRGRGPSTNPGRNLMYPKKIAA